VGKVVFEDVDDAPLFVERGEWYRYLSNHLET
jgi:hypothetical protein